MDRNLFSEKWLYALLACVVVAAALGIPNVLPVTGTLAMIAIMGPIMVGSTSAFLDAYRKGEKIDLVAIFKRGFNEKFVDNLLLGLLLDLFVALWSLLFVIPGIIMGYAYSMAAYIKVDHPEKDAMTCIRESKAMMKGHKMRLFLLDLSFIGWMIVASLTFGIGYLWLAPYMQFSHVAFYEDLKGPAPVVEADATVAE